MSVNEATWTPASELCPHPEWWTSRDIDATETEVLALVFGLVRGLQPEICIETGTYLGDGTRAIASALEANGHGVVHTFETDPANVDAARAGLLDLEHRIVFHDHAVEDWEPEGSIDFAFFDSSFGARVLEYTNLRRFMTPRTVVSFHDTAPHHPLRPMLDGLDVVLIDLPTPRGISLGQIPREEQSCD
jgi:predicted O-methyltransferase YrrM